MTLEVLDRFPRAALMTGPTPLERLDRLSEKLGIDLWIKRDDLSTLSFGGNKNRQLEYYFGAAQAAGADTVLITGAVQSNYARIAAAAAARLGLKAILQLEDRVPGMGETYATSGNVLLGEILDAEFMRYPEGEDEIGADRALRARAEDLRRAGRVPFVIPLGLANPPLGALGYMRAAEEIQRQAPDFDAMVVASGSGLTHAGLLAGVKALGLPTPVFGSCVRRPAAAQTARLTEVCARLETLLEIEGLIQPEDIRVWDKALTPGYGRIGEPARTALTTMARHEGLFLDPVYTAKGFAAVLGLVEEGSVAPGTRVLFVHTGGLPAIFAYQEELATGAAVQAEP